MKKSTHVEIQWKPDKTQKTPVYRQIIQYVCEKTSKGEWPVGTKLPSQREMAELFGVNRSTITSALEELFSYGIVEGSRGGGTRIVSNTWSLMLQNGADWSQYIEDGDFQGNNFFIRKINRLEFVDEIKRLGTGEPNPSLLPVDKWKKVLNKVSERVDSLGYLEPLGLLKLRQEISKHLGKCGIHVPPSCILITSGSLQALQLISVSLLKKGTTVYTESPSYLKSLQIFQSAGMKLCGIPMEKNGISCRKLQEVKSKSNLLRDSILYTIPSNQNPTGITMDLKRREELLAFCKTAQLPMIEDGAYQELYFDEEPPMPLKAMDESGTVIYLGSASKSLAPGLRTGWVIASEPIVQRLGDVKMQMDYGASSLSQWAMAEFFESGLYEEHLLFMRAELKRRRNLALEVLESEFKELADWNVPGGGFYIWLTWKRQISAKKLFAQALQEHILLNPGDIYDFHETNSIRLSYAYVSPEEFRDAAIILARIVRNS